MRKDFPVKGIVAGALANNGFEITDQIFEYVTRPPALDGSPDAYGLRVVGVSMEPLHRPGDLCIVHPYRPYRRRDSVIVQVRAHEGAPPTGYIKIFKRETDDMLYCEQYNPPAEIAFKKTTVLSVHKVLTVAEMFGA
jgi:phage repressor protein C with HTH and peptisase S24 domain